MTQFKKITIGVMVSFALVRPAMSQEREEAPRQVSFSNVDIILVGGNPLEDLEAVTRYNVDFVMKDGLVYKNWLPDENAPAFLPPGPKREAYFGNL